MRKLIDKYQTSFGNADSVQSAVTTLESNKDWIDKNGPVIADFLERESGDLWRLRNDIIPVSYNIRLLPFIEENNFTTDGYVEMIVDCEQETNYISFNTAEIDLDKASVKVFLNFFIFLSTFAKLGWYYYTFVFDKNWRWFQNLVNYFGEALHPIVLKK